jgi:hypothetical protein
MTEKCPPDIQTQDTFAQTHLFRVVWLLSDFVIADNPLAGEGAVSVYQETIITAASAAA